MKIVLSKKRKEESGFWLIVVAIIIIVAVGVYIAIQIATMAHRLLPPVNPDGSTNTGNNITMYGSWYDQNSNFLGSDEVYIQASTVNPYVQNSQAAQAPPLPQGFGLQFSVNSTNMDSRLYPGTGLDISQIVDLGTNADGSPHQAFGVDGDLVDGNTFENICHCTNSYCVVIERTVNLHRWVPLATNYTYLFTIGTWIDTNQPPSPENAFYRLAISLSTSTNQPSN